MPDYPRPKRILTREGTEITEPPYVPELSPVTDRQALLMTRPWLDWCRRVTGFIQHGGGGGDGGTGTGDVTGPSTSINDAIAIYNGTTGKIIKDSLKTIANVVSDAVSAAIAAILPGGTLPIANLPFHHTLHEPGGSDALAALSANILTIGTLPDARLSANVQMKPVALADLPANVATKPVPIADGGTGVTTGLTQLSATNLTSGIVPDARIDTNIQRKPIAAGDLPAHATRHHSGGADPVTVTALAGYPGGTTTFLRADGTFTTPAGAGDVSGPASAVADNLASYNGTTGKIIKDSGVPAAQVARRDQSNTFTQTNQFDAQIYPNNPALPVDQRKWAIVGGTDFTILPVTDAGASQSMTYLFSRTGGLTLPANGTGGNVARRDQSNTFTQYQVVQENLFTINTFASAWFYEAGRSAPMGHWINIPYSAANFTANAGAWNVTSGQVLTLAYCLIGQSVVLSVCIIGSSTTGAGTDLYINNLPFTSSRRTGVGVRTAPNSVNESGSFLILAGNTTLIVQRAGSVAWGSTSNSHVEGQIVCPLN